MIGTELEEPIINAKSASYNITNESGINGTTRFLKNVTGLWMLEETKKQLEKEGRVYSYDEITELAERSQPFSCYVNTDHPDFQLPGNMPAKIKDYAKMTYQRVPETDGEIFRVIYESLALKYRDVFEEIMACTGKRYSQVHIVGGGSQAGILCQMVANASEIEVVAGPVEATVIGNSIVQLLSQNTIANLAEARKVVRRSFETKTYYSVQHEKWDVAFRHFKDILREDVKGGSVKC
ncbi:FGGY-family carbohydrate kinase [Virgibacillus halophilus]|uniref:FGGY-family carbohydrate kinase n=1 Tax=Tigheibacillus halophilus TaxID=361280 RepID=A0ABU5C4P1_9BACI|nr:FGGY-family carbohydrate kinase [Virgibacillus halophilus]